MITHTEKKTLDFIGDLVSCHNMLTLNKLELNQRTNIDIMENLFCHYISIMALHFLVELRTKIEICIT